jgi:hypothetical protein
MNREIGAFIFHEFASPITALLAGIDCLQPTESADDGVQEALRSTVHRLSCLLDYMRTAFACKAPVRLEELRTLIYRFFETCHQISIVFPPIQGNLPPDAASFLLVFLLWGKIKQQPKSIVIEGSPEKLAVNFQKTSARPNSVNSTVKALETFLADLRKDRIDISGGNITEDAFILAVRP